MKDNLWRPDSCSCQFRFNFDDAVSESSRTQSVSTVPTKCAAHSSLASDALRWSTVLDENPRVGISLLLALANGPSTLYNIVDNSRQLKPTIKYNWSWSGTAPNRVLNISFTGITLTTQEKTTIQNAINARLGSGKVVLS